MASTEKLIQWIENGKQLGNVFSFDINGKTIWSSVGIQKWQGIYKVYVDEIDEENMVAEKYLREEIKKFIKLSEAIKFIEQNTQTNLLDMQICKGQRVFNPEFD